MPETDAATLDWGSDTLRSEPERWSMTLTDHERTTVQDTCRAGTWDGAHAVRERIRHGVRSALEQAGFALVHNVLDVRHADPDLVTAMHFLMRDFGTVVPQNGAGDLTQVLRDRDGDGNTELGFHCDTCDLLVLLCLQPAAGGGDTKLASGRRVRDILRREHPGALAHLSEDWVFDRTGRAGPQRLVRPVFRTEADGAVDCYYQTRTIRNSAERPFTDGQEKALRILDEVLYRPEIAFRLRLVAGDLLIIRNNRVMHGRSPYVDAPGDPARRILRLWVDE